MVIRDERSTLLAKGLRCRRGVVMAVFVMILFAVPSLATDTYRLAIEKGGRREFTVSINNGCPKSVKWRVGAQNLELAGVRQPEFTLAAGESKKVIVDLDTTRSERERFKGSITLDCINCKRKRCSAGSRVNVLEIRVVDFGPFEAQVKKFVAAAGLWLKLSDLKVGRMIQEEDVESTARQLVNRMVFLEDDGKPSAAPGNATNPNLEVLAEEMVSRQLVQTRRYLVQATWEYRDNKHFSTVGIADDDGRVVYEPILYFENIKSLATPEARLGSCIWEPWRLEFTNGLGTVCYEVDWKVAFLTSNCRITDQGPHILRGSSGTHCWAWTAETFLGEQPACWPSETECGEAKDRCVRWAALTHVVLGISKPIERTTDKVFNGIPLEGSRRFEKGLFGVEAEELAEGTLCACAQRSVDGSMQTRCTSLQ